MPKSLRRLPIACLLISGFTATAGAQVIAHSIADYSGVQGQDGWFYGAYTEFDEFTTFRPMTEFDGLRWWVNSERFWTMIGPVGAHPNGHVSSGGVERGEQWAARRWVSDYTGLVEIAADLCKINVNPAGNGVTGMIWVDGVEIWRQAISATDDVGVQPEFEINVVPGTTIDFVMNPTDSNDWSDNSRFSAVIQAVPAPGAGALALVAGVAVMRRRRR